MFLEEDFSLKFLKLLALLSSLLKLFTLLRLGLALRGLSRGELGGRGDLMVRGDGDLEGLKQVNISQSLLINDHIDYNYNHLKSWKSKGLGDLETAGVERGESSLISQYSSLISDKNPYIRQYPLLLSYIPGVDCLLLGQEFSSLFSILCSVFLNIEMSVKCYVCLTSSSVLH